MAAFLPTTRVRDTWRLGLDRSPRSFTVQAPDATFPPRSVTVALPVPGLTRGASSDVPKHGVATIVGVGATGFGVMVGVLVERGVGVIEGVTVGVGVGAVGVTEFEAAEAGPVPSELLAVTVKV